MSKLARLSVELGAPVKKIGPLEPEIQKDLTEYSQQYAEALHAGERYLKEPRKSTSFVCPACNSVEYFDLFGGMCQYICARCGHCYNP